MKKPLNPDKHRPGESEFGWGPGLVPPGKEMCSPRDGGMYAAMCPPTNPDDYGTQRYSYPGERASVDGCRETPYAVERGNRTGP